MQGLLETLRKKDEDLVVVEQSDDHLVIETSSMDDPPEGLERVDTESSLSPPLLLKEEMQSPTTPVSIRVIRSIYIVNATYTLLFMIWGLMPYFLFRYDVSVLGIGIGLAIVGLATLASYVAMYTVKDQFFTVPLIGLWMFLFFMSVNMFAALIRSLAPFQAVAIVFCQSLSILIYCFFTTRQSVASRHRHINVVWATGIMLGAGLVPWLCGIYAFVRDNDWITAFVLFLFIVIGSSLYNANQLRLIDRFDVSREDLVRAVVHYYTDALFGPIRWIAKKWQERTAVDYPEEI